MAHLFAAPLACHIWPQARCLCDQLSALSQQCQSYCPLYRSSSSVSRRVTGCGPTPAPYLQRFALCRQAPSVHDLLSCQRQRPCLRGSHSPPSIGFCARKELPLCKALQSAQPSPARPLCPLPSPRTRSPREAVIGKSPTVGCAFSHRAYVNCTMLGTIPQAGAPLRQDSHQCPTWQSTLSANHPCRLCLPPANPGTVGRYPQRQSIAEPSVPGCQARRTPVDRARWICPTSRQHCPDRDVSA